MKRYGMRHVPLLSFYSGDLYWDVCHRWRGRGFLYLFLLLAACWLPRATQFRGAVDDFVDTRAPGVVEQIPEITIVNGVVSADVNQPYTVVDPETGQALFLLDTTGTITNLENTKALALVTKNELTVRQNALETRSRRFPPNYSLTLDRRLVTNWLEALRRMSKAMAYPVALVSSWIFRVLQMLVYAVIGRQFAAWIRHPRSYDALLRLSAVAVTPAILVKTILAISHIQIPSPGLCYFLAAMCCLTFGIKSAAIEVESEDPNDAQSFQDL